MWQFCNDFSSTCVKSESTGEVLELVEQAGLENRCTFAGTVGSNPTLSASLNDGELSSPE